MGACNIAADSPASELAESIFVSDPAGEAFLHAQERSSSMKKQTGLLAAPLLTAVPEDSRLRASSAASI